MFEALNLALLNFHIIIMHIRCDIAGIRENEKKFCTSKKFGAIQYFELLVVTIIITKLTQFSVTFIVYYYNFTTQCYHITSQIQYRMSQ